MISLEEQKITHKLKKLYSQSDIFNFVAIDNSKISPADQSTEPEGSRINLISVNTNQQFNEELNDLPEEWITYDFERKRSCILSNLYSTCVTKAINHLEALQLAIDKWLESNEYDNLSPSDHSSETSKIFANFIKRKSTLKTIQSLSTNTNQKLRFADDNYGSFNNLDSNSNQLEIQGHNFDISTIKSELVLVENSPPIDDLRASNVLEEILVLIARLELDRKRTENLLRKERENLNTLKKCIENMALQRAIEIPLRVQHEHDACVTDITELNWHISFNTKAERKLRRKVEIEERLHQRLKEEITNIKKNTPLIEGKIKLELTIIEKIETAQSEVDKLVDIAKQKLQQTQERSDAAYNKAAKEREAIQADLANCRRDLNKAKKRLQEALDALNEYSKTIVECNKKVEENLVQEKIETKKRIELKEKNEILNEENRKIQTEILRVSKDVDRVRRENEEKDLTIQKMIIKFNDELAKLTEILNKKLDKMDKVLKKKQEKEIDLEEMARDKANMENKIAKEIRNRDRLLEDRQKIDEELKNAEIDLNSAIKLHGSTIAEYEKEMRRLENKEDNLKKQISELRKQISDERNQLTNLVHRLNAENEEFLKAQKNSENKRKTFELKKIELDEKLSVLEIRVSEIETIKKILLEEVRVLNENLEKTLSDHKKLETELTKKIEELEPEHSKQAAEYFSNKANLDYMKSHTIEMNNKMKEMTESKKVMNKTIEKINEEIEKLEPKLKELIIQCDSNKKLDDGNKTSLEEIQQRIDLYKKNHEKHKEERNEYLKKMNIQLDSYLELNKELASRYRYLKYVGYNRRLDLMRQIEIKLSSLVCIKDRRQIISLQERMHNALNDFFKFRIKNGEKNFHDLKEERESIGDDINSLEHLLNQSVNQMTKFLEKETDFSEIRNKAIQKVIKQELIEKQQGEKKLNKISEESSEKEQFSNNDQFNLPIDGINLRNRNRNFKIVPPV